jgi:hypothetical protein
MKRISTLLLALSFAVPATAQETPAHWASKLGSSTYSDREKAALMLEQLGKAALPALQHAAATADLETKRRAVLIMERIEERLISEELIVASPLQLRFKDVLLDDALREVEGQTGLALGRARVLKRIDACDTGLLPFWQAWRKFTDTTGLAEASLAVANLRRLSEDDLRSLSRTLDMMERNARSRFVPQLGFANEPVKVRYSLDDSRSVRVRVKWHELDRALDAKTAHAIFAVEVRAEPRLEIVKPPWIEITKIVDARNMARPVKLAKLYPEAARTDATLDYAAFAGEIQHGGLLQLKPVAWEGPPEMLKEIHGRVRLEVMARPKLMEIADVAKSIGKEAKSFQGVTMKVLEADRDEEGEILLRVNLNNLASLAPLTPEEQIVRVRPGVVAVRGEIDVALERLELYNSAGRKCQLLRARYEHMGKGKGYDVELTFATSADKTDAVTLAMTKGARAIHVEMPFLVRDVKWE